MKRINMDTRVRDKDKEQLLNELRKLHSELAQRDGKLDKILGNTELLIEKADAILRQTFELAEYTVPRLFIILPEHKTTLNPANWWTHSYRLYFICECELERHFAFHKGYKIKQPRSFFRKYGPYLKNMLTVVRVALSVSSFAMPQIGSLAGFIDQLPPFLFEKTFQEGLSKNLNNMVDVVDNALNENLSPETINDPHGIDMVEGAELRLGTAIIGESSVKKLDEMLDVLCRGLSIFKMIFTNCKIRMKTFEKLLFIATQRNLIDHIEFRDVL